MDLREYLDKVNSMCERLYEESEGVEVVTLLGSVQFKPLIDLINLELTSEGFCVYTQAPYGESDLQGLLGCYNPETLAKVNKCKLNKSQALVVVNPGHNIDAATKLDITFALSKDVKVFYLEE